MKPDETRSLPKKFLKTLRAHKKELLKMEKEGAVPMNVDCLYILLNNKKYEITSLKKNTKRAIEEAKGEW